MKNVLKCLTVSVISLLLFASCLDEGYGFDDLDKNGEFNLPVIPLGNLDKITIDELPNLPAGSLPGNIVIPDFPPIAVKFAKDYTVKGLFDEEVSKRFFYEGKKTNVNMKFNFEGRILPNAERLYIVLRFDILDANGQSTGVKIKDTAFTYSRSATTTPAAGANFDQQVNLEIAKEYMSKMKDAKDLKITIVFDTDLDVNDILFDNYLQLTNMQLYAGSMAFEI